MDSNKALELAKSAYPHDENLRVAYMLGVDKGYEFCREQMLKGAVGGMVCATITNQVAISFSSPLPKELKAGDKVRILVLKAEEE